MIPILNRDLQMKQGSRFEQPIIVMENNMPKNLTGYTARMQIREWKDSDTFLAEYTTANNKLTIAPEAGRITIVVPSADTAGYDFGDAFYDLEVVDGDGDATCIMEGRISLIREVTR